MSVYLPPTENLPIFDSAVFKESNEGYLTYEKANKYFLKYPSAQGKETLQAIDVNGVSQFYDNLTMKNTSGGKRIIQCGDFKMDDNAGTGGTSVLQIFTTGNTNYYKSLLSDNTSSINFQLKNNGGTNITPLKLTPLGVTTNVGLTAEQGITVNNQPSIFNAGLNVYATSTIDGTVNLANNRTLSVNAGAKIDFLATSSITMASANITQSGTISNTLGTTAILANNDITFPSGTGKINQTVTNSTDTNNFKKSNFVIVSGVPAGSAAVSMETWDDTSGANGRGFFFAPNAGSGSFNNIVKLGDGVISGRNAGNNNNALTMTCWSTKTAGLRIDCTTTAGTPTVEILAATNQIYVNDTRTTFSLKSTFKAGLYTSDVIGHATAGNSETTALTLSATQVRFDLPLQFGNTLYGSAKTTTQLGYSNVGTIAGSNYTTSTGVQYLGLLAGTITLPPGIWLINVRFAFAPSGGNVSITQLEYGISLSNSAMPSSGTLQVAYNIDLVPFTLNNGVYYQRTVSCPYENLISTGTTSVFPVFKIQFSGGTTNVSIGCVYSYTRIG